MRSRSGTRFLSPAARLGLAGKRSATSADESLAPSAAAEASANASRSGAGASARSNAVAAARSRVATLQLQMILHNARGGQGAREVRLSPEAIPVNALKTI